MRLILVTLVVASFWTADAEIPRMISYQGKVTDAAGTPVADGSYSMQFRIYDAVTGGTLQWDSGARTVAVAGGVFSVLLGESPQPVLGLDFSQDCWLEVTLAGAVQSPRQRMGSVGYAYMASGLVPGTRIIESIPGLPEAVLWVQNTATTGATVALYGRHDSPEGIGVTGMAAATTGENHGVYGRSYSTQGVGVYGLASSAQGETYGVRGQSVSTMGTGVFGSATSTTGATFGVRGEAASSVAVGVYGNATHGSSPTAFGGYFHSGSTAGIGVAGYASASSGTVRGVWGSTRSPSGRGVYGEATCVTGDAYGVFGTSTSTNGAGVHGIAYATTGPAYGVQGTTSSTAGAGVYGKALDVHGYGVYGVAPAWGILGWSTTTTGSGYGVAGSNSSSLGAGVHGWGENCGVKGSSTSTTAVGPRYGVHGYVFSYQGWGVFGEGDAAGNGVLGRGAVYGVYGEATSVTANSYGVYGTTESTGGGCALRGDATGTGGTNFGVHGTSASAGLSYGVCGETSATDGTTFGVYGGNESPDGWGVYYSGGLGGTGAMRSIVRTSQGPTGLNVMTATENWVEDFGEGRLVSGRAHIALDPLFLETVTADDAHPMHVFVQLHDPASKGVAVIRGTGHFEVVELDQGRSGGTFSYRVIARCKGTEAERLPICPAGYGDPNLYPELKGATQLERFQHLCTMTGRASFGEESTAKAGNAYAGREAAAFAAHSDPHDAHRSPHPAETSPGPDAESLDRAAEFHRLLTGARQGEEPKRIAAEPTPMEVDQGGALQ